MKSWILISLTEMRCYDLRENDGDEPPFPVHNSLIWADVTDYPVKPEHGWTASELDGEWTFTDPNPPPPLEGE